MKILLDFIGIIILISILMYSCNDKAREDANKRINDYFDKKEKCVDGFINELSSNEKYYIITNRKCYEVKK